MSACCSPQRGTPAAGQDSELASRSTELLEELAALASTQLHMVGLPGGSFLMGSAAPEAYVEDGEGPVREATVEPFAVAATTVTNAEFAPFVLGTGHRTDAETHGDSLVFEGLLPDQLRASSVAVRDAPWWRQVAGATWLEPCGNDSTILDRPDHPVTHVSQRAVDWNNSHSRGAVFANLTASHG